MVRVSHIESVALLKACRRCAPYSGFDHLAHIMPYRHPVEAQDALLRWTTHCTRREEIVHTRYENYACTGTRCVVVPPLFVFA